jgi:predicted lipoprotein with Yx(FWY)xxD motif
MRKTTPAILATLLTLALGACNRHDEAAEDAAEAAARAADAADADTADTTAPDTATPAAGTTLAVAGSGQDAYLTDSSGRALYVLEGDDSGTRCTGDCLKSWHAAAGSTPTPASADVQAPMIATVSREDGTMQWTYNGHPLYYFDRDTGPGMYAGQAYADTYGHWYLVRPTGELMPASFPARMTPAADAGGAASDSLGTTSEAGGASPTASGADAKTMPTQSPGTPPAPEADPDSND